MPGKKDQLISEQYDKATKYRSIFQDGKDMLFDNNISFLLFTVQGVLVVWSWANQRPTTVSQASVSSTILQTCAKHSWRYPVQWKKQSFPSTLLRGDYRKLHFLQGIRCSEETYFFIFLVYRYRPVYLYVASFSFVFTNTWQIIVTYEIFFRSRITVPIR